MNTEQKPLNETESMDGKSPSTAGLCAGDKVQLTKSIWDDGEDHHPPGWLATKGEILVVRSVGNIGAARIAVSHGNVTDRAFMISQDEFEAHN